MNIFFIGKRHSEFDTWLARNQGNKRIVKAGKEAHTIKYVPFLKLAFVWNTILMYANPMRKPIPKAQSNQCLVHILPHYKAIIHISECQQPFYTKELRNWWIFGWYIQYMNIKNFDVATRFLIYQYILKTLGSLFCNWLQIGPFDYYRWILLLVTNWPFCWLQIEPFARYELIVLLVTDWFFCWLDIELFFLLQIGSFFLITYSSFCW